MPLYLQSLVGFIALFAIAWVFSEKRHAVMWRTVFGAIALQVVLGVVLFKFPYFDQWTDALNNLLSGLQAATLEGTKLVFGYIGGGDLPFKLEDKKSPFVLATQALPLIIVVSALSSLLFYWKILPLVVNAFSWVLRRTIGVGGAVGVSTAANIFLGTVEAPMFIKPYIAKLSRGELFVVMTGSMAGIAGTVMALYALILRPVMDSAFFHILIVSFISAPAAIAFSALMVPHEGPVTDGTINKGESMSSAMDAVTQGTVEGVQIFINIVAMLLVLTALIAIANQIFASNLFSFLPQIGGKPMTLQSVLGWVMSPIMWLTGIPWAEAETAGALMGTKTVLNELIAYVDMANLPAGALSPRSQTMMIYSMCGFANFASLGILIGGMGTMCPERRGEIINMGYKCLVAGTLSTLSCGALVGIIY
jgi:concentrative nucleoside transporter, CNT family